MDGCRFKNAGYRVPGPRDRIANTERKPTNLMPLRKANGKHQLRMLLISSSFHVRVYSGTFTNSEMHYSWIREATIGAYLQRSSIDFDCQIDSESNPVFRRRFQSGFDPKPESIITSVWPASPLAVVHLRGTPVAMFSIGNTGQRQRVSDFCARPHFRRQQQHKRLRHSPAIFSAKGLDERPDPDGGGKWHVSSLE